MIQESLLTKVGKALDEYRRERQQRLADSTQSTPAAPTLRLRGWLPTPGNVLFTAIVIVGLLWAQSVGAITLGAPLAAGTSTGTIAYQGRLADTAGQPLTGTYNMTFRLYAAASGGTPLWEETWTGPNSVQVSDGLLNVMLGSLVAIPQSIVTANSSLFLGITVGTDSEMAPRVQLGSVPFAVQALTVPDGSITTAKLRPDTGQVGIQTDTQLTMPAQPWTRVNVPQMTMSITLQKQTRLLVWFSSTGHGTTTTTHSLDLILQVDGVDYFVASDMIGPSMPIFNIAGMRMFDLPNGTHEVRVQVQSGLANDVITFPGGRVSMAYLAVTP